MAEAKPTGAVVRSGYLLKEGGWNKNWKKRFFKLKDNKQMNYYEGENSKTPLGVIDMKAMYSCKASGSSDGNFQMDCASRKWKLRAENPAERDAWIQAINDVASGKILQVKPQHTYGTPSMPSFAPAPQQNSAPQQNQVPQQTYQQPAQPQQTFQQQTSNGSSHGEGEVGPPVQAAPPVSSAEGLPSGWTTGVDPSTGRTFYVNTIMQTTQWERPAPASNSSVAPPPSYQQVQQKPQQPMQSQVQQQPNQQPGNIMYQQGAPPGGFSRPGPQQPYQQYNQPNQQAPPPQAQQQPGNSMYQQGAPPGGFSRPGPQQPYQQYNQPNQQAPPPQAQYNQPGAAPAPVPAPAQAQPMNYHMGAPPGGFSRPGPQQSYNPNANQPQQNYQPPQQQQPQPNAPAYPNLPPALAPPQNYPGFTRFDQGTIGIEFVLRQGKFVLTVVRNGSPAQEKGVRVGMQIESVYDGHGKPVQGSNAPQLAQQISYAPRPVHIKFANANVIIVQRCYNPRPYYVYRRRHGYNTAAAFGAAAVGGMIMGAALGGPHHGHHRHHRRGHGGWGRGRRRGRW